MEIEIVMILLGAILSAQGAQTIAVWVKFSSIEKRFSSLEQRIEKTNCPFGGCPLYERARTEAVRDRDIPRD